MGLSSHAPSLLRLVLKWTRLGWLGATTRRHSDQAAVDSPITFGLPPPPSALSLQNNSQEQWGGLSFLRWLTCLDLSRGFQALCGPKPISHLSKLRTFWQSQKMVFSTLKSFLWTHKSGSFRIKAIQTKPYFGMRDTKTQSQGTTKRSKFYL